MSTPSLKLLDGKIRHDLEFGRILERADGEAHPETLSVTAQQADQHIYMEGKSGSGKTMLLRPIVWSKILHGEPCAVIDPVGSLVPATLEFLGALNMKLAMRELTKYAGWNRAQFRARMAWLRRFDVLDFTDVNVGGRRFNPLQPEDGVSVDATVGVLLSCFERVIGDLTEMRRLQMVLRAVFTLVARMGGGTLRDAVDFLCMDTEDIHAYLRRLEQKRSAGRLARPVRPDLVHQYVSQFFACTANRERRELVQSAWNAISVFLTDAAAACFVSSPVSNVSFGDIVNGRRWLLVHLPTGLDLNTQKVLGAMIVNSIQLAAERRASDDVESGRVPRFSLICDEFQLMFGPQWAEAIARVRNKGLSLVVAHQTDTQPPFETEEGASTLRAFRANASVHCYFRLWWEDAERAAVPLFRPRGHQLKREEKQVTETSSVSWAETVSKSVSQTISEAFGRSDGFSTTVSTGENKSIGFSESNGVSRVETDTVSVSQGKNWSRAESKAAGLTVTVTDSETIVEGHGKAHGFSRSHGSSHGAHEASTSLSAAVNDVVTHTRSLSRGKTSGKSRSATETASSSRGGSESTSSGNAIARGLSQVKGSIESIARSVSTAEATQKSFSRTMTESLGSSHSVGQQHGGSYSRGETVTREYYSVAEEIRIRSYELSELPPREAWVLVNGATTSAFKIRTHNVPQKFTTTMGGRDYKAEFLRVSASAEEPAEPAPVLLARAVAGARRPR